MVLKMMNLDSVRFKMSLKPLLQSIFCTNSTYLEFITYTVTLIDCFTSLLVKLLINS